MSLLTNLFAYWKLDESSGNAADSVGSNTLTNTGTVTYSTGKINNGANFSGSGQWLQSGNVSFGAFTNATISLWVKLSSSANQQVFFSHYYSATTERQISFGMVDHKLYGITTNNGAGDVSYEIRGNTAIDDGNWHHVVFVYHGQTTTENKVYLDGSDDTASRTGSIVSAVTDYNIPVTLGGGYNKTTPISLLTGSLDEVGFWLRSLSSTEITQLYKGGNGFSYPFNTGTFLAFM